MDVTSACDPQPSGISMPGRLDVAVHVSRPAVADRPLYQGAAVGDNVRFGHADAGKVLEFGQPGHAVRRGRRYAHGGIGIGVLADDRERLVYTVLNVERHGFDVAGGDGAQLRDGRKPLVYTVLNVERPVFDVAGEIAAILDLDDRAHARPQRRGKRHEDVVRLPFGLVLEGDDGLGEGARV